MKEWPSTGAIRDGETDRARPAVSASSIATGALLSVWALLVVGSFLLDDTLSPRFFDLPLGAFLAGQGALMGMVIVGIRVARSDLADGDR